MTRGEMKRASIIVAIVIGLALLYGCVFPAVAAVIKNEDGGFTPQHDLRFQALARKGEKVIVDGTCKSACTLVLARVPLDRICATPRAAFGFHAFDWYYFKTKRRVPAPDLTKQVLGIYPKPIQQWIEDRGGWQAMPRHPRYWYLRGAELDAILKRC